MITDADRAVMRADHEALMLSTVTIGRSLGWVYDPVAGTETQQVEGPYYTGRGKVQSRSVTDRATQAGGQTVTIAEIAVAVPWEVAAVEPGHVVHVTDSPDPGLTGRTLIVQSVAVNDFLSARLLTCTLNQG